jgi:hypoxanthine phosphoribosyltransferase
MEKGIPRKDLKIAVHDYKYFYNRAEHLPVQPDYWCRKHELSINDEDLWIHYSSHELIGLTPEELETHYYSADPELREALGIMHREN